MAISILECIDSEKEPGQATDAKHKFAKKTIHRLQSMETNA